MVSPDKAASAAPSQGTAPQAQALPAQQNITVTNRHLDITPFVIDRDPLTPPTDEINERKILNVNSGFLAFMNRSWKKNGLIIYGGRDLADLKDSIPDAESTDPPADEYTKFSWKPDKHYLPKKNKDHVRFELGNLQQEEDESLAKDFAWVREMAEKSEYPNEHNTIQDHLIKTMRNRRIQVKAIWRG